MFVNTRNNQYYLIFSRSYFILLIFFIDKKIRKTKPNLKKKLQLGYGLYYIYMFN